MKRNLASLLLAGSIALCGAADRAAKSPDSSASPGATAPVKPTTKPVQGDGEKEILTDLAQLTTGSQFVKAGEGYFSPDMKWAIFQGVPPGESQYQMYVAPLRLSPTGPAGAFGPAVRITPHASRNTCGFFSPDNKSIIFASTAGKENPADPSAGYQRKDAVYRWFFPSGMEIYRADDWLKQVESAIAATPGQAPAIDLARTPSRITDNNVYDAEDAFSPDGKWICFTSLRSADGDVYVMHRDGSHVVRITSAKGYDGGPFFSPDGKRLVYRSDRKGNDLLQIFVADLAFDASGEITGVSDEHQLTDDQNVNWGPYWFPDGKHIIFATSRQGHQNYELYTIRDDGSHATRITYTDGFDGLPAFSPDGKLLMWSSKRAPDNTVQLFLARFHPPAGW